ncbi:MAG: hypothetical protein DRP85_06450 [Candidatus Makaraimicrobium thalassicum]|nr:MAG: hypothetical protein DRP85_06450 [Candidatus Omnitrophota bacterium]
MQTLLLGYSGKKQAIIDEKQADKVQELEKELARTRGKLGYQVKINNQMRGELDGRSIAGSTS